MQRCAQMSQTEFTIESSSSTKTYRVRAFLPEDEPWTCDCVAYNIARNRDGGKNHGGRGWCKHLEEIHKTVCSWQEGAEIQSIPGVCPRCGGPTTEAPILVLPESPKQAAEKVTASLLAMQKDLENRA